VSIHGGASRLVSHTSTLWAAECVNAFPHVKKKKVSHRLESPWSHRRLAVAYLDGPSTAVSLRCKRLDRWPPVPPALSPRSRTTRSGWVAAKGTRDAAAAPRVSNNPVPLGIGQARVYPPDATRGGIFLQHIVARQESELPLEERSPASRTTAPALSSSPLARHRRGPRFPPGYFRALRPHATHPPSTFSVKQLTSPAARDSHRTNSTIASRNQGSVISGAIAASSSLQGVLLTNAKKVTGRPSCLFVPGKPRSLEPSGTPHSLVTPAPPSTTIFNPMGKYHPRFQRDGRRRSAIGRNLSLLL
jgi:hypothetical protein